MLQGTEGAVQKRDTEFYGRRMQTGVVLPPHGGWLYGACVPTHNWCSVRRNRFYYNVKMKPSNYFPGNAVRKKMEMKTICTFLPSARRPCRQWDLFSAHVHWSSLCWLQCSSVNLHQQRRDLLLAWNLYRQSIIQAVAGCVFCGATSAISVYTSALCEGMRWSCLKQPKHVFMNRELRHYYGNLILSVRSKLLMVFSSRKCKILFQIFVHCGVMCFIKKIVRLL